MTSQPTVSSHTFLDCGDSGDCHSGLETTARWKTGKPCVRWFAIIGKVRSPKPRRTRQCQALGNFQGGCVYAHAALMKILSSGMEEEEKKG